MYTNRERVRGWEGWGGGGLVDYYLDYCIFISYVSGRPMPTQRNKSAVAAHSFDRYIFRFLDCVLYVIVLLCLFPFLRDLICLNLFVSLFAQFYKFPLFLFQEIVLLYASLDTGHLPPPFYTFLEVELLFPAWQTG